MWESITVRARHARDKAARHARDKAGRILKHTSPLGSVAAASVLLVAACAPQSQTQAQAQAQAQAQTRAQGQDQTQGSATGANTDQPQGPDAAQNGDQNTAPTDGAGDAPLPEGPDALFDHAMDVMDTDRERAFTALEGAALQGHVRAAYRLARQQKDPKVAIGWYSMAAAGGDVEAAHALGRAYLEGLGTAREPAWGVAWFERAARAGHAPAQHAFALAMLSGTIGPMRPQEALAWMLIARANGFEDGELAIHMISARLSDANVETAHARAAAWTNDATPDGVKRAEIRFAQYALARLGYQPGLPDGIDGERTAEAVATFRRDEGLGGGDLDARTLDRLRAKLARLDR